MDTPLIGLPNTSIPRMPLQGPSLEAAEAPAGDDRAKETAKLKKAAQAFEGYFIYMLMKEMQKTSSSKEGGLFGSGASGDTYQYLFQQAMSNKLASANGGFGLTKMMMREFQKRAPHAVPPSGGANGGLPLSPLRPLPPLGPQSLGRVDRYE
jgi:Rod binding domain-containing protein